MANTNANSKFYFCTAPQQIGITQADFENLTWTEIESVGKLPESGSTTNIVKYDTINTTVTQKAKGVTDAGGGNLECAYKANASGQAALREAAQTNYMYATKRELDDAPDSNHTNTIFYNLGIISGPTHTGGGVEDFATEVFTIANNQQEIVVPSHLKTTNNTTRDEATVAPSPEEINGSN